MAGRRILYLTVLAGCLVFCYAYREWISWLLLAGILCLPFFSLALSLPAMLKVRLRLCLPKQVVMNTPVTPELEYPCPLPAPPVRCKLRVRHSVTREELTYTVEGTLPTEHSAALQIRPIRIWAYDYLGLFRRRLREDETYTLYVLPEPVPPKSPPELQQRLTDTWKPKPGGGLSENYDLRLYRPGDSLRQIHWKLAAKTGDLIVKELMEPLRGKLLLRLILPNTEEEIDDVLGTLLWTSRYLLRKQLPHTVCCLTGNGRKDYTIANETGLMEVVYALLSSPAAPVGAQMPEIEDAAYWIGGASDAK